MSNESSVVAARAVVPGALPLNELTLIGTVTGPGGASALLRTAHGDIVRVTVGDTMQGLAIIAIGDQLLQLTDAAGQSFALRMPLS
jgi:Tfp pilus assembly protein PilP